MKFYRGATALGAAAVVLVGTLVGGHGAGAVPIKAYSVYAGGAYVKVNGDTVTSDLSAPSTVQTGGPNSATGSVANATLAGLLTAGAVTTTAKATPITGGYDLVSHAVLSHISLLNGAITADALDTMTEVRITDTVKVTTSSHFLGLSVGGKALPNIVAQNTGIRIPGVASVVLNYVQQNSNDTGAFVLAAGIAVTLLKPVGDNPIGALVLVGPSTISAASIDVDSTGHGLGGYAYGTFVNAAVGTLAGVHSDQTANIKVPFFGTDGKSQNRSIASVALDPAAHVGAITNTVEGVNTPDEWEAHATSKVAGINLFNGLIRADAITAEARSAGGTAPSPGIRGNAQLVNLRIGGTVIPIDAAPNTSINLANLGVVTINQQIRVTGGLIVRGIDIVLSTARYGFPAGAEVQVAVAKAVAV